MEAHEVPGGDVVLDGSTRRLDPRARTLWAVRRAGVWFVLGIVWAVVGLVFGDTVVIAVAVAAAVIVLAASIGSARLSYRYWSWSAHDDAIELTHGVIYRHLSVVPYHRVQQIDIERGPIERLLGIATLVLRSAAATTDAKIPGIAVEHSEQLRHALLARVGADDAV